MALTVTVQVYQGGWSKRLEGFKVQVCGDLGFGGFRAMGAQDDYEVLDPIGLYRESVSA